MRVDHCDASWAYDKFPLARCSHLSLAPKCFCEAGSPEKDVCLKNKQKRENKSALFEDLLNE